MDEGQTVFVTRHGFLSSLVLGICGMISITVVCATAVGLYGLYIVDDKIEELVGASPDMVEALTDWQQALPPALADAIDDRRDLNYQPMVDASVELVDTGFRSTTPVIEVVNRGDKVITLLSMRVTVDDDEGIPTKEMTVYAATPLTIDSDWRGPLLPGNTRRFAMRSSRLGNEAVAASLEVTELRVWKDGATIDDTAPDEGEAEEYGEIQLPERDAENESTDGDRSEEQVEVSDDESVADSDESDADDN